MEESGRKHLFADPGKGWKMLIQEHPFQCRTGLLLDIWGGCNSRRHSGNIREGTSRII